jgi:hypothetical protein
MAKDYADRLILSCVTFHFIWRITDANPCAKRTLLAHVFLV